MATLATLVLCEICNGQGRITAGQVCPVCEGKGMALPERLTAYRGALEAAAVEGARKRFEVAGDEAAQGWLRVQAQARTDATEAAARAREAAARAESATAGLTGRLEAIAARAEAAAQRAEAASHGPNGAAARAEAAASRAELVAGQRPAITGTVYAPGVALPPDPTDPPPGITLPAGMGGELNYMDSLLVRQLDVWGPLNAPSFSPTAAPVGVAPLGTLGGPADDGANITAVFNLLGPGSWVQLVPGASYTLRSTLSVPGALTRGAGNVPLPGCRLSGGRGTTLYSYFGGASTNTGAAVSSHGTEVGGSSYQGFGAVIEMVTIDGANVPGTTISTGLDYGDQYDFTLRDVTIQNFTSTGTTGSAVAGSNPLGAVGLNSNNQVTLTEKQHITRVTINNCTNCFQTVTTTGGSTSRMYSDIDLTFNTVSSQNGWVMARQGHLENGELRIRGNMNAAASGTNTASLIVVGVAPGGSAQQAHSFNMKVDINIEADPTASGALRPTTITFGTNADNTLTTWRGRCQFSYANGWQQASGYTAIPSGQWQFSGRLHGDSALSAGAAPYSVFALGTVYTNNGVDAQVIVTGGTVTSIVVGGITTGLTAGTFLVPMNQTIQINGSVAPAINWITALVF